jgi:hypothetical protein
MLNHQQGHPQHESSSQRTFPTDYPANRQEQAQTRRGKQCHKMCGMSFQSQNGRRRGQDGVGARGHEPGGLIQ